jgi:hypothetical protein
MLFTRGVSGTRVVTGKESKIIGQISCLPSSCSLLMFLASRWCTFRWMGGPHLLLPSGAALQCLTMAPHCPGLPDGGCRHRCHHGGRQAVRQAVGQGAGQAHRGRPGPCAAIAEDQGAHDVDLLTETMHLKYFQSSTGGNTSQFSQNMDAIHPTLLIVLLCLDLFTV